MNLGLLPNTINQNVLQLHKHLCNDFCFALKGVLQALQQFKLETLLLKEIVVLNTVIVPDVDKTTNSELCSWQI